jgi:hypothetical protein
MLIVLCIVVGLIVAFAMGSAVGVVLATKATQHLYENRIYGLFNDLGGYIDEGANAEQIRRYLYEGVKKAIEW